MKYVITTPGANAMVALERRDPLLHFKNCNRYGIAYFVRKEEERRMWLEGGAEETVQIISAFLSWRTNSPSFQQAVAAEIHRRASTDGDFGVRSKYTIIGDFNLNGTLRIVERFF